MSREREWLRWVTATGLAFGMSAGQPRPVGAGELDPHSIDYIPPMATPFPTREPTQTPKPTRTFVPQEPEATATLGRNEDRIGIEVLPECLIPKILCGKVIEETTKRIAGKSTAVATEAEGTSTPEDAALRRKINRLKNDDVITVTNAYIGYIVRVGDNYYGTLVDSHGTFLAGLTNVEAVFDAFDDQNALLETHARGVWATEESLDSATFQVLSQSDLSQAPPILELQGMTEEGKASLTPKTTSVLDKLKKESLKTLARATGRKAMEVVLALVAGAQEAIQEQP